MEFIDHQQELTALVENILGEAKSQGADEAEVSVSMEQGLGVSVRKGELENLEFNQDRGFGITRTSVNAKDRPVLLIAAKPRYGKPSWLQKALRHTEEDPHSGLADAHLMASGPVDLGLYNHWPVEPEQATAMAVACEEAGLALDSKLTNSDGAQVSTQQALRVYGNSHGFLGAYPSTRHSLSCVLIGEDNNGMQRDYWYSLSRQWRALEDPAEVGLEAAKRTLARLSPRKAPTGKYPVILAPNLAAGLIGHLNGAISGGAQYRTGIFSAERYWAAAFLRSGC